MSSHIIDDMHITLFYLCSSIVGIVFIALMYSLIKHRYSQKSAHFHSHFGLELMWTIVPFLILIGLALPAIIQFMDKI